jgi:hypothetical protein
MIPLIEEGIGGSGSGWVGGKADKCGLRVRDPLGTEAELAGSCFSAGIGTNI